MARFLLTVIIMVALLSAVAWNVNGKSTCPKNEVWKSCGTACEPSCDNRNPEWCTAQCVIGCQCKPEYLRNSNDKCVHPNEC